MPSQLGKLQLNGGRLNQRLHPVRPSAARSALMARVKQRGTAAELLVRRAMRDASVGFRTNAKHLPGRPDVYIPSKKVAIFVHGCFWHRHRNCAATTLPKTNVAFWRTKFRDNLKRDRKKARALRELGYRVLVIWECQTRRTETLNRAVAKLKSSLRG
ncbi:MAG: very short patch repair endonuclease [Burkholderiales bacterium]